jgi:hypothetical protein
MVGLLKGTGERRERKKEREGNNINHSNLRVEATCIPGYQGLFHLHQIRAIIIWGVAT